MANILASRLNKLESKFPDRRNGQRRVARVIVHDGDFAAAYRQAADMGIDTRPDSDDVLILRVIVTPNSGVPSWPV